MLGLIGDQYRNLGREVGGPLFLLGFSWGVGWLLLRIKVRKLFVGLAVLGVVLLGLTGIMTAHLKASQAAAGPPSTGPTSLTACSVYQGDVALVADLLAARAFCNGVVDGLNRNGVGTGVWAAEPGDRTTQPPRQPTWNMICGATPQPTPTEVGRQPGRISVWSRASTAIADDLCQRLRNDPGWIVSNKQ